MGGGFLTNLTPCAHVYDYGQNAQDGRWREEGGVAKVSGKYFSVVTIDAEVINATEAESL